MHYETSAYIHSYTRVPTAIKFAAFRAACEGGGTPPDWTQKGDNPRDWASPADAAGGLLLFGRYGAPLSVQPPARDQMAALESALNAAESCGLSRDDVIAAYFSSGGRGVFLIQCDEDGVVDDAWVFVSRSDPDARLGASEENMAHAFGVEPALY